MYAGTDVGGAKGPNIRSVTEGIQLGKMYVDNNQEWLLARYKPYAQNAVKSTKDKPYCLPSSAGGKNSRKSTEDSHS